MPPCTRVVPIVVSPPMPRPNSLVAVRVAVSLLTLSVWLTIRRSTCVDSSTKKFALMAVIAKLLELLERLFWSNASGVLFTSQAVRSVNVVVPALTSSVKKSISLNSLTAWPWVIWTPRLAAFRSTPANALVSTVTVVAVTSLIRPSESATLVSPGRNTAAPPRLSAELPDEKPSMTSGPRTPVTTSRIGANVLVSPPSTKLSSIAVTVTICGVNQFAVVKVRAD